MTAPQASFRNLFVQGLHPSVTDGTLRQWFADANCGNVVSAKVMMNARTGQSRCIGFVLFETEDQGRVAHAALKNATLQSGDGESTITVEPSCHHGALAAYETCTMYLRNIPAALPEASLERLLQQFGRVVSLSCSSIVLRKRTAKVVGEDAGDAAPATTTTNVREVLKMACVEFDSVEAAKMAIETLHNTNPFADVAGHTVSLMAKFGDTDEIREHRKRTRQARRGAPTNDATEPSCAVRGPSSGTSTPPQVTTAAPSESSKTVSPLLPENVRVYCPSSAASQCSGDHEPLTGPTPTFSAWHTIAPPQLNEAAQPYHAQHQQQMVLIPISDPSIQYMLQHGNGWCIPTHHPGMPPPPLPPMMPQHHAGFMMGGDGTRCVNLMPPQGAGYSSYMPIPVAGGWAPQYATPTAPHATYMTPYGGFHHQGAHQYHAN